MLNTAFQKREAVIFYCVFWTKRAAANVLFIAPKERMNINAPLCSATFLRLPFVRGVVERSETEGSRVGR